MQIIKKNKTLIIAEVGPNHNGSIKTALIMIKKIIREFTNINTNDIILINNLLVAIE